MQINGVEYKEKSISLQNLKRSTALVVELGKLEEKMDADPINDELQKQFEACWLKLLQIHLEKYDGLEYGKLVSVEDYVKVLSFFGDTATKYLDGLRKHSETLAASKAKA